MAKKNNNIMWGIMVLVVILLFNLNWEKPYSYNTEGSQFIEKEKENSIFAVNLGSSPEIDICYSLQPYLDVLNLENLCIENGGTWKCFEGEAGCSGLPQEIINCESLLVSKAILQCRRFGGQGYCDKNNLFCQL